MLDAALTFLNLLRDVVRLLLGGLVFGLFLPGQPLHPSVSSEGFIILSLRVLCLSVFFVSFLDHFELLLQKRLHFIFRLFFLHKHFFL